ncbi:MAG: 2-oxo acid dehydrogenase subunit E2 [Clostridiaceae bacterium]|nr:2-oxo acid dehydrogenase subunit E2 [Clostridiaceae bacterium]
MATAVIMPRQGQSVESCIIGEFHKQKGDTVSIGDALFTYETDKATFDEQAKVDGTVLAILVAAGDDVPVLDTVMIIGEPGEDIADLVGDQTAVSTTAAEPAQTPVAATAEAPVAAAPTAATVPAKEAAPVSGAQPERISPRARNLAARSGADLRLAQGSGPQGRVIERDVEALVAAGHVASPAAAALGFAPGTEGSGVAGRVMAGDTVAPPAAAPAATAAPTTVAAPTETSAVPEYEDRKLTNIRKVIARTMHKSLSEMAQLTLHTSFDATDLLAIRARLKKAKEAGLDEKLGLPILAKVPTFNDLVLYATARVLLKHKELNAHLADDTLRVFNTVHLGVAVDTPRGLMVPTVRSAETKSLAELGNEVRELAAACQTGSINPDLLAGGTFTVTNVGSLGVEYFTPVINPPQVAILGVCGLTTKLRMVNGEAVPYQAMGLSLTHDHRAIDGAPAARFLKDLCTALENLSLYLID